MLLLRERISLAITLLLFAGVFLLLLCCSSRAYFSCYYFAALRGRISLAALMLRERLSLASNSNSIVEGGVILLLLRERISLATLLLLRERISLAITLLLFAGVFLLLL